MIWSVDMDDFSGSCLGSKFPLITAAKDELKGYYVENLETTLSNGAGGKSSGKYLSLSLILRN